MTGPLEGIRVVELGVVIAGPAAAAMLGDWGATVIKIEPPEGDPQRGNLNTAYFELDNRGKRSICLDLKTEGGRDVLLRLIDEADVFVTNLRMSALARLGLDYEALSARNPRLVYAAISGYGLTGLGADKAGYDIGAYWSRAGVALTLTPPGGEPPVSRPGLGDHPTGLAAAAGISAALFSRERTGKGQLVSTSLLRGGAYALSSDLITQAHGFNAGAGMRRMQFNPMLAAYQSSDGKWFWLLGVQATRHLPGVARVIGRPDLLDDPRFADLRAMVKNRDAILEIFDAAFRTRTMDHWAAEFAREDIWWDPVQTLAEAVADPIVADAGVFREIADDGRRTVATPVDFSDAPFGAAPRAPESGEHTEQVLLELGFDWDDIARLQAERAIP